MTEKKNCPNCAELIMSDAILCRFCESGLSPEHFQQCPQCSEMIRKDALVCRYCKSSFEQSVMQASPDLTNEEEQDSKIIDINSIRKETTTPPDILSGNRLSGTPKALPGGEDIACGITAKLRQNRDLEYIIQEAIELLQSRLNANRVVIWRITGDRLWVTNESATDDHICFLHSQLTPMESTNVVLEILSRFPNESGTGVIEVKDTSQDQTIQKVSPTISTLIELGSVQTRLIAQLRSQGLLDGFIEVQRCEDSRAWSKEEASILENVAVAISSVVRQVNYQSTIDKYIDGITLLKRVSDIFNSSLEKQESMERFAELVAEELEFEKSQLYLINSSKSSLEGQLDSGNLSRHVNLGKSKNGSQKSAISQAFNSLQHKLINIEYKEEKDPVFGYDAAVVLPLVTSCERLGVFVLYKRKAGNSALKPVDLVLLQSVSSFLAQALYIEKLKQ